ncbi:CHC2 zinc finger domain-containing protein [Haloactinopolyspora alba]|uniref:CHC2 zinc finger domain-containing protein n=1 Tax=Haloactinopolyspora alba TaxID=648780 RepID=UPI003B8482A9
MVRCPVHDDRTPSCSLDLRGTGLWNCHRCGEGGDVWNLIMKKEGTDFRGARAAAATLGFATGDAGGGDDLVPEGRFARSRGVPDSARNRSGRGGYVPAGLRRRPPSGP